MVVTRGIVGNQEPGDSGGPFHDGRLVYGVISAVGGKDEGGGHIPANYTAVAPILPWVYRTIALSGQFSTGSLGSV
ncbi:trypsin-like serine protease [Corynebacterium oculi]|uniref:trypsin-like serine protease n=1 Tax=Corynebacterium oculi TaxID=1544416 RepID=UPI003CCBDE16